jgi:malonyl-CoA O-methyltransferase
MNDEDPFAIDKRLARLAFERAAATYDEAAVLQREVGVRMLGRLDYIKYLPRSILDAGSGTGQGTRALLQRFPKASVLALDIARGMLQRSQKHLPRRWPPFFFRTIAHVCADIERLPVKSSSIDMVWCNLTLQWLNDPHRVFVEMHRALRPEGLFMFSTFGPDTLKELREAYTGIDRYSHVHRFADMHDLGDMLVAARFVNPVMEMERISMTYSDLTSLMRDLKSIGAHNVSRGRRRGLTGKTQFQAVARNYEQFRREGRLPATFEVVYGHAWKPESPRMDDGKKVIRLEAKSS